MLRNEDVVEHQRGVLVCFSQEEFRFGQGRKTIVRIIHSVLVKDQELCT